MYERNKLKKRKNAFGLISSAPKNASINNVSFFIYKFSTEFTYVLKFKDKFSKCGNTLPIASSTHYYIPFLNLI